MFFLLFAGYSTLRPVRETMGIAGGVDNLQWLFTGTFTATLAAIPLFGWIASRAPRRQILPWTYGFFALNLLGFAAAIADQPGNPWIARAFYIWLSVFNLLAISVAWSVLADLFPVGQAKRLFAVMAAGASAGRLVGPLLGVLLVGTLGLPGLLVLSSALLLGSAAATRALQAWRDHRPLRRTATGAQWAHRCRLQPDRRVPSKDRRRHHRERSLYGQRVVRGRTHAAERRCSAANIKLAEPQARPTPRLCA